MTLERTEVEELIERSAERLGVAVPRIVFAGSDISEAPVDCFEGHKIRIAPAALNDLSLEELEYGVLFELSEPTKGFADRFATMAMLPGLLIAFVIGVIVGNRLQDIGNLGYIVGFATGLVVGIIVMTILTGVILQKDRTKREVQVLGITRDLGAAIRYAHKYWSNDYSGDVAEPRKRIIPSTAEAQRLRKAAEQLGLEGE